MKIESKWQVAGVGCDGGAGQEVTLAAGTQSFRLKTDRATARGFASRLYEDVRVVVDAGPEHDEPESADGDAHDRYVRKPYRLAKERSLPVFAAGATPEDAIRSYAEAMGWGEVTSLADLPGGEPCFTWGRSFTAGGTSFRAAGWDVPGGVVVTWWK